MKEILLIIILVIILCLIYYLYTKLNIITLSTEIIKNISENNVTLTSKEISDLQKQIDLYNNNYITNNENITKNYNDILTKLAILNTTKLENLNTINSQISELQKLINNNNTNNNELLSKIEFLKNTKTDYSQISELIKSTSIDIQQQYTNAIQNNNTSLMNNIISLINNSIQNNNTSLTNNINTIIQKYIIDLNKTNDLLSTNLTNYIQTNDNNYKNLNDIIMNYIKSNNNKINEILNNLSSVNINTYITNNDLNIKNLSTKLQDYSNIQSENITNIQKSITNLQKMIYNNTTDINKLPNKTITIIDAINNINDNLNTNIINLSNITSIIGDLNKLPNNSTISSSIVNLNNDLNKLISTVGEIQNNIKNNNKDNTIIILQNNINNINNIISSIQTNIGNLQLPNNSKSLSESINILNNIINNLQSNYTTNLNSINNIQNNIGDLSQLPNNTKNIIEAINSIQKKISSYNLDNINNIQQTLTNITNILGNTNKLNQSFAYIKDITNIIEIIQNDIISFKVTNKDITDLLETINKFLLTYNNSYYTSYNNISDFNNEITIIMSKINNITYVLSSTNTYNDLNKYLVSVLNIKQGIINRLLEPINKSQDITTALINIQYTINDLMNNNIPLKSQLASLQTKFNSLDTMIGVYPLSNSTQSISSIILDINKNLTNTMSLIGTGNNINNTTILNNIQDIYFKLTPIQNNISQLFNQTSNINNIQQQLSQLQTNIGTYKQIDNNNPDISTAISNLQNSLAQNLSTSTILTSNMNNIKNIIGNYQNALNGQDIITYITNINATASQLQNYIGNVNKLNNYNPNTINNIVSAINNLNEQIYTINNNLGTLSINNLLTRLQTLELANNTLNSILGNLSYFSSSSTISNNILNLNNNMNLLMTAVGNMNYPYGLKDATTTLIKMAKYIGNAEVLQNDLSTSITNINSSIKTINSIIGDNTKINGIDIITYTTGLQSNLSNYNNIVNNLQNSVNALQTSINTFTSNNNTLTNSVVNLQNAIGTFTPTTNNKDISSSLNYILKSIGNFISNKNNPDITTNLNNLNTKLSILNNDINIYNLIAASTELINGFTNIANLQNMSKYNTNIIINQLKQLNQLLPEFSQNSMNILIVNQLNIILNELNNFKNIMSSNLINGLNTYNNNLKSNSSYTSNQDLTIYTTINPLLINFNNLVNIILGTKENPTIIGGINNINNNIIQNNTDIQKLQQSVKFIGNYLPNNNNPDISTAINNLQTATQYIGDYQSTKINPNISTAIQNLQNAIGTYTNSTNIVNSLNTLNTILGNYKSTTDNPDISTAILNLQTSINKYIPTDNYPSDIGTAVLNLQTLTSNINNSINNFNKILGTYSLNNPDINTAINNINNSIKYIGNYIPTLNNPDISTAINNINTSLINLQNNNSAVTFNTILSLLNAILPKITTLYNNNTWNDKQYTEGLYGALQTYYSNLNSLINNYDTYGYNPNYINVQINNDLVNLLKQCNYINSTKSTMYDMFFDDMFGVRYNNSQLIKTIQIYLGKNSQSIESSILLLQNNVKALANNVSGVATIINDNNINNLKLIIPNVISSLNTIVTAYNNGLNTSASLLQKYLNTLLTDLNTYTQYSSNTLIYNDTLTILNFIKSNTSFNGQSTVSPFLNYNTQINILIPYLNIITGTSSNPSISADIFNIKNAIGTYSSSNSNIANDLSLLKSYIGSYNNSNYTNTTTPATIAQDLINLNTEINNLKTNITTASSTINSPLIITGNIPISSATTEYTFSTTKTYQYVVTIQNGIINYGYFNGYTYNTKQIHNPISQYIMENYPNRCVLSNVNFNMPYIPSGTFNILSPEGLMIQSLHGNQYNASITPFNSATIPLTFPQFSNLTTTTITLNTVYSRDMEINNYNLNTINPQTLDQYLNAIKSYTNKTKNNKIYCIKGTLNITAPIQNIPSYPAQTTITTKNVNILGPSSLYGINKGITINDTVNLSNGSLYVPNTIPQMMNFDSTYNPNGLSGGTNTSFSYCPNNSYVCGMTAKSTSGTINTNQSEQTKITYYYPLCCNFNQ